MRCRQFRKRVEFWQTSEVSDGVGGYTVSETLITSSWANVSTMNEKANNSLSNELGVADRSNTIVIKLRKRNDITYNSINQFIKYRGLKYVIQSAPTNIDFNDSYITILATRQQLSSVTELTPFDE